MRRGRLEAGKIFHDSGAFIMDHVALDLSDTGAALQPASAQA